MLGHLITVSLLFCFQQKLSFSPPVIMRLRRIQYLTIAGSTFQLDRLLIIHLLVSRQR
uniref:Uncharacterized protein n=1 Tax=Arundo donax TaxID=35708 RepID=A0A0A9H9N8_ARUDO